MFGIRSQRPMGENQEFGVRQPRFRPPRNSGNLCPRAYFSLNSLRFCSGRRDVSRRKFRRLPGIGNKQETPRASTPIASRHGSEIPRIVASTSRRMIAPPATRFSLRPDGQRHSPFRPACPPRAFTGGRVVKTRNLRRRCSIAMPSSSSTVGGASWPQPVDSTQGDAFRR